MTGEPPRGRPTAGRPPSRRRRKGSARPAGLLLNESPGLTARVGEQEIRPAYLCTGRRRAADRKILDLWEVGSRSGDRLSHPFLSTAACGRRRRQEGGARGRPGGRLHDQNDRRDLGRSPVRTRSRRPRGRPAADERQRESRGRLPMARWMPTVPGGSPADGRMPTVSGGSPAGSPAPVPVPRGGIGGGVPGPRSGEPPLRAARAPRRSRAGGQPRH